MKLMITVEGKTYEVDVQVVDEGLGAPAIAPVAPPPAVTTAQPAPAATPAPAAAAPPPAAPAGAGGDVQSPIAGNVLDVKVKPGDVVAENDTLLVLEAMKMESNVASPQAGTVKEVLVAAGDSVSADQVLLTFA